MKTINSIHDATRFALAADIRRTRRAWLRTVGLIGLALLMAIAATAFVCSVKAI